MARDLRHRVAIQHNVESRTKGVRTDNWLTLETVYARIKTMGAKEFVGGVTGAQGEILRAGQREGLFTHEVEVRHRDNFGGILQYLDGSPVELVGGGYVELSGTYNQMLPRYRLQFGTRVFNIHSVIHPYPGNDKTVMRVKEVVT